MPDVRDDTETLPTEAELRAYWQYVRAALRAAGTNPQVLKIKVAGLIRLGAHTPSPILRRKIRDAIPLIHARAGRVTVAPDGEGVAGRLFRVGEGIWYDACPMPEAQSWRRGFVLERNKLCGRYLVRDIDDPKRLMWISEPKMVRRYAHEIAPGRVPAGFVA